MTKIRFENSPSTNTPINANNLNKLNNVVISSTEPTTGEEVWIDNTNKKLYTKNDNGGYEKFYDEEVLNKKYELKSYTNWQKTYIVNYDEYTPVIVVVAWQSSIASYGILLGRVVELGKTGTDSISYEVNQETHQVTFTLGDTGVFRTISLTQ